VFSVAVFQFNRVSPILIEIIFSRQLIKFCPEKRIFESSR
jgi:hypothetical protein